MNKLGQELMQTKRLSVEKVWHILQGLPKRQDLLSCELLVAYKCFVNTFEACDTSGLSSHLLGLKCTLQRVCEFLDVRALTHVDVLNQVKSSLVSCIRITKVSDILIPLGLLCLLVVFCLINKDRYNDGRELLHAGLDIFYNIHEPVLNKKFIVQINRKSYQLMLAPPTGCNQSDVIYISHLMHKLLAYLYLYEGDLDNSMNHTNKFMSCTWNTDLYLKVFVLFKQARLDETSAMLEAWRKYGDVSHCLTADLWNLCGCLFSLQNRPNMAIQMYKEAMKIDFENIIPLMNIAKQYSILKHEDAELEVLNSVIATLKQTPDKMCCSKCSSGTSNCLLITSSGIQIGDKDSYPIMSLEQALYSLCRRCLHLRKFNLASDKYLDLLALLHDNSMICQTTLIQLPLPSMVQIFLECAYSLICSKQYENCVTVCNKLIECCPQCDYIINRQTTVTEETSSKDSKRKRESLQTSDVLSQSTDGRMSPDGVNVGIPPSVVASLYKADALLMLSKLPEAYTCIDSVTKKLQSHYVNNSEALSPDVINMEPVTKRVRLDSGGTSVPSCSLDTKILSVKSFLTEAYCKKSIISLALQRTTEALTNSRLAMVISKDNINYVYNHTLLLYKLGRHQESAKTWLSHRGIPTPLDQLQCSNILKRKRQSFLSLETEIKQEDGVFLHQLDDRQLLNLDIVSLMLVERLRTF